MSTTLDMKTVLEAAANSPDPTVRGIAIRRMEIDKEREQLDAFFGFYGEAKAMVPAGAAVVAKPKNGTPVVGANKLIAAVRETLLKHGKPMPLAALFEALGRDSPDRCPPKQDSLRVRLSENRTLIGRTDEGYWPTDVPAS